MNQIEFTPGQAKFLSSSADICLFGGSAGPGKTFGLLVDALGLNPQYDKDGNPITIKCKDMRGKSIEVYYKIEVPTYRALLVRRRYKHLQELRDKSKQLYPLIDPGVVFTASNDTWTFSSGATIQFLALPDTEKVTDIQGRELQYIGLDELGTWPKDDVFLYCLSRLRSSIGLPCYLRATSNPSRYPWLRKYFCIPDDGKSTYRKDVVVLPDGTKQTIHIEYIQAFLSENKHLDASYAAKLSMLPEADRLALLSGAWNAYDSVDGAIYELEIKQMIKEGRYSRVPHDRALDTYVYSDIGVEDLSVFFFVQYKGMEVRIIDSIYGNNQGVITHWIPEILDRCKDKGYRLKTLYLPHDGAQREKSTGISTFDQAIPLIPCDKLPRLGIADGIEKTKMMFRNLYIDSSTCDYAWSQIQAYKRKYDATAEMYTKPVHDHASHFADALRYISYIDNPATYGMQDLTPSYAVGMY